MLYVRIPLIVRCRTLSVHITYTTPTRSSFYAYKYSRTLEWKHSCSSGYSSSTGQVSTTIIQLNIIDCYSRRASCHTALQCFFLTLERSKSTRPCFSPYLLVASLNFSLDYWQSHQGRRPQAMAPRVLLASRYRNSSSVKFYS